MSSKPPTHTTTIKACLDRADLLNDWELRFLRGLHAAPQLTPRQHSTLAGLLSKIVRQGAPR